MRKGENTRTKLLDVAETSILQKGFAATSIEELIAEAGITKSGFFYHFSDKNALARELLQRYIEKEEGLFNDLFDRARQLHEDPLHAFLIGLKLLAELLQDIPNGHPGCLVATYCYNERLFDREVRDLYKGAVSGWRNRFRGYLDEIAKRYPPRDDVDLDMLADMANSSVEGGIVMAKAMEDPRLVAEQVLLFRSYVRLLFDPSLN